MKEIKSRIPFKCPKCGHETNRGLRQGSALSTTFRCESCGEKSTPDGYWLFSVLYGIVIGGLMGLLTYLFMSWRWSMPFEYAAGVAVIIVLAIIFFLSGHYWRMTLRWRIQSQR